MTLLAVLFTVVAAVVFGREALPRNDFVALQAGYGGGGTTAVQGGAIGLGEGVGGFDGVGGDAETDFAGTAGGTTGYTTGTATTDGYAGGGAAGGLGGVGYGGGAAGGVAGYADGIAF